MHARLAATWLLALCSCNGLATYHTAEPLPPGKTEFVIAPAVAGVYSAGQMDFAPMLDGRLRFGVTRDLDLGVGSSGFLDQDLYSFQVDANYVLWRAGGTVGSLDPTYSSIAVDDVRAQSFWLPLLVDVWRSERTTVTVSFKYLYLDVNGLPDSSVFNIDQSGSLVSLGVSSKMRVGKRFSVIPELNLLLPLIDSFDETRYVVFGLGFAFG